MKLLQRERKKRKEEKLRGGEKVGWKEGREEEVWKERRKVGYWKMPASNFAGSAGSLEKKSEKVEKTVLFYRRGMHPEGLSNRVIFTSTETFRKGRCEPFRYLEKGSQGIGNSKFKVLKAGVCSII